VHSLSGYAIDLQALGEICQAHGIIFVANCSQALGARPLNVSNAPVDAITCAGFKWLCGPYGTGFCWIDPELRETLEYNKNYWLSMQTADDLGRQNDEITVKSDLGAQKYDILVQLTSSIINLGRPRSSIYWRKESTRSKTMMINLLPDLFMVLIGTNMTY